MTSAATKLTELLSRDPIDLAEVGHFLDGLTSADRIDAISTLQGVKLQRRLYQVAAASPRVTLEQIVPSDFQPLREIIYHGKNSLPAFTLFQKRFCRPPADKRNELWGYNQASLGWLVGPGYFVVHDEAPGAAIDYRAVPPRGCDNWPSVAPNDAGFSRFVYKDMVDYLRRVSKHVFIGSATKYGKEINSYFVLCRDA